MRILALALPFLLLGLAGCTEPDGEGTVVHNDCTEHPQYGTGNPHVRLETTMGNITAEIFVDKVMTKGGKVTRIPAQALAIWMFKSEDLPATEADLVQELKTVFNFSDPEFVTLFDPDS